jgi:uncharacterized protein
MSTDVLSNSTIQAMADCLVKQFHPDKVILFGSYAYGTPGPDSDVDFLVIMDPLPVDPWWKRAEMQVALSEQYPAISTDVLLHTWTRAQKGERENNPVLRAALRKGRLLYER